MKVLVTLFWSAVIGEVVGYIITALAGVPDEPLSTLIVSLVFGLFVLLISEVGVVQPKK
ncbi:MAG TPA: DUF2929 domain-containing protein [Lactococcus sp.]|uniref:YjzD family protein n=2 Tax=Lactococcus TaxID=1357 RepID=A0ABV4D8W8_9LACT|nr:MULTISPECIES: DUF2929 family protein [Lactococcus]MBL3715821.1 DUF2929 family protein [Lactococcus garvieae]HAP14549.1 DUF2929 domain-containing protein [Lactococcus sp.]HBC90078.1 DUF2929 domain-containing protein [Lactococcus sp.]